MSTAAQCTVLLIFAQVDNFQNKKLKTGTSLVGQWLSLCASNAGATVDVSLIPGLGRHPGEGNGNPLQHSCWDNSMDRGAWWATGSKAEKS